LTQRPSKQIGLAGRRRIVEVQVYGVRVPRTQVDALGSRERFLDEGATAGFAAHQTHLLQLRIHPRGRDQREAFASGKVAMRWQTRSGAQTACTDLGRKAVDELLVARLNHVQVYP
jgi:hypothetical protein